MERARVTRPSLRVLLVALAAMLLTGGLIGTAGAAAEKIELCHAPFTPAEQTINVEESAVGSHINHGDLLDSCEDLIRPVLDEVVDRGFLRCGVSEGGIVGFSEFDGDTNTWSGLDVDLCRAVAAAVLGQANDVEFVELSGGARFDAVRNGSVDVLIRTTTDTLGRDALFDNDGEGVNFGPTYFYDGASFLAYSDEVGCETDPEGCGFDDLAGLAVCVQEGTPAAFALLDLQAELGNFDVVLDPDAFGTFVAGVECNAFTSDQSALAGGKAFLGDDVVIFNVTYTKEPLAPVVRDGDDEWMSVVRWVFYAAFFAEELGLDQGNIAALRNSSFEASRAFGDGAAETGERLGLGPDWSFDIIEQVGNYAEMYENNLTTPLGLLRGRNASYLDGGLIYTAPMRPF